MGEELVFLGFKLLEADDNCARFIAFNGGFEGVGEVGDGATGDG